MPDTHLIPNRPEGWSLADEGYIQVTRLDYYGIEYQAWEKPKRRTAAELWKILNAIPKPEVRYGSVVSSWIDREKVKIMIERNEI